jgi:hypothetical protein
MIRQYTINAPWAATQNENGQPKKLNVKSRAKYKSTNVTKNHKASKSPVILKFLPQYSWCLAVSCIVISFLLKNQTTNCHF